ncbi:MAG: pyrroloquinoline quinone-dependent dehydrogenase [Verrucomicrobia bacterium]|nr:pyrroloquinoline quinone-dependent dehydrogenase [Verrucomicrobiota bacterium]MDA1066469.1 pyrroloquinoline quinone-dependent dehydrogenase [Verrucomicrobiota bacterium]
MNLKTNLRLAIRKRNKNSPISTPKVYLFLIIFLIGCSEGQKEEPSDYSTWSAYAGSADAAQYSSIDQINTSNVGRLELAWSFSTEDNNLYFFAPLVVENRAYVLAKNNSIVAIDASNGKEVWTHTLEPGTVAITNRGINYWESKDRSDRRLFFASDHFLRALDAETGTTINSFGKDGSVNLKEGLGRDPDSFTIVQSRSPGRVFEDLLILGSATNEGYGSAPGDVRAYDVRTGKLVWSFHTIPHPGEFGHETWPEDAWKTVGGANVWTEFTLDVQRKIVYLPVASAKYNFYGADRAGTNLYSNCLVALDARTGERIWHFQFIHHDIWDYDPATAPKLLTVEHQGEMIDVVAQATKQGFVYVFDRVSGIPLWPIEERKVPIGTEMPRETLWPTQPFPTVPPPFARQTFTVDDLNPYIETEERAKFFDYVQGARNEGLFTPPGRGDTIQMPGNNGGANWGGGAVDPKAGMLYVVSKDHPAILKLEPDRAQTIPPPENPELRGSYLYDVHCHNCHTTSAQENAMAVSSLVGVTDKLNDQQILNIIKQGQGPMPGNPSISESDMQLLVDYLKHPTPILKLLGNETVQLENNARFVSGFGLVRASNGLSLIGPPWTTITAYDLNEGTIKWQIPLGEVPELAAKGIRNTGSVYQKVGPVVTAGGLLFAGSKDKKVRAFDSKTGELLWEREVSNGVEGIPAVYQVGGRQYILFCASSQSGLSRDSEVIIKGEYIAFALPEN